MKKLSKKSKLHGRIHIEHVEAAALWAIKARKVKRPTKIDGVKRTFNMGTWDCGTACCLAGGAALEAGHSSRWHRKPDADFFEMGETKAGLAAGQLHDYLRWEGPTAGEMALARSFENNSRTNRRAPEHALAACAAIRKERGLPPRKKAKKARRKESRNAS